MAFQIRRCNASTGTRIVTPDRTATDPIRYLVLLLMVVRRIDTAIVSRSHFGPSTGALTPVSWLGHTRLDPR